MATTTSVIVYSAREELIGALRKAMEHPAGQSLQPATSAADCVERLVRLPDVPLVVDWLAGSEEVNHVLGAIRRHFRVEVRPIMLVIPQLDEKVIAIGTEYGVSQIHSGTLTPASIGTCLAAMLKEDAAMRPIRDAMLRVAVARENGEWSLVTPMLAQLVDQYPDNERLLTELAENLIQEELWDRAMELLEPLVRAEPPHIRALHLMGRCYLRQGRPEKAIAHLTRAKVINPHNIDRLIELGHAFLGNNQIPEALSEFDQALALDEDRKEARTGKGQALLMSGEINEALVLLKEVSGPRELASIFNTSAILSVRHGEFGKGLSLYRAALVATGKNNRIASRLIFNLGLAYERWGRPERALTCSRKSLELDPSYQKAARLAERAEKEVARRLKDPSGAPKSRSEHPRSPAPPGDDFFPADRPGPARGADETPLMDEDSSFDEENLRDQAPRQKPPSSPVIDVDLEDDDLDEVG